MRSFFLQGLNLVSKGYIAVSNKQVSTEFLSIRPKICGNIQITKNFITQEIRRKSQHFTLLTHENHYPFQKEYDGSTMIVLLKRIEGYTRC